MDLQQAFDEGFEAVKAYLDTEFAAIRREFADLVAKSIPAPVVTKDVRDGIDGRDGVGLAGAVIDRDGALVLTLSNGEQKSLGQIIGKDGESVTVDDVAPMLKSLVSEAVSALPKPKDGDNGESVTIDDVTPLIKSLVDEAVSAIPVPKDGLDATPLTTADLAPLIEDEVSKAVSALPTPKDGDDGKSVSIEDVAPILSDMVAKAVSELPKPNDGKSVTLEEIAPLIKSAVDEAISAIPVPKDGDPGASVTAEDVAPLIKAAVADVVAALPAPEKGDDGKSVTLDEVAPLIAEQVSKAISEIPVPRDGIDGKSVTIDDVAPLIAEHVSKAVSEIPVPRDGIDGKSVTVEDIAPLVSEQVSKAISDLPKARDGIDGRDGIGIASALKDADGQLVLTMTDGTVKQVGSMIGQPGKDGFSLKDFDVEQIDDGRTLLFSFDDGHIKQSVEIDFPISIYRGIYQEGKAAKRGDCYTWAGSMWHCEEATTEKPGEGSKSWRLAVKRGRDGKDFKGPDTTPTGKVKL